AAAAAAVRALVHDLAVHERARARRGRVAGGDRFVEQARELLDHGDTSSGSSGAAGMRCTSTSAGVEATKQRAKYATGPTASLRWPESPPATVDISATIAVKKA